MGIKLQQVTDRTAARERYDERHAYALDGAALVREIHAATFAARGGMAIKKDERAALVQVIAAQIVQRGWHGRPRDVLAWIDRAERMPATAAREYHDLTRRSLGRKFLVARIERVMHESRAWRDVAETHKVRERRARERSGPAVSIESYERAENAGILAQAAARNTDPEVAPLPANVRDWADAMAADIDDLTDTERRRVLVALLVAGGIRASVIAAWQARSMNAVQMDSKRGAALLRDLYPDPSDLIAHGRIVADEQGLLDRGPSDAPQLGEHERAALEAVQQASGWVPERKVTATGLAAAWRTGEREPVANRTPLPSWHPARRMTTPALAGR